MKTWGVFVVRLAVTVQTFFGSQGHWMTVGFVRFSHNTDFIFHISSAVCVDVCLHICAPLVCTCVCVYIRVRVCVCVAKYRG